MVIYNSGLNSSDMEDMLRNYQYRRYARKNGGYIYIVKFSTQGNDRIGFRTEN